MASRYLDTRTKAAPEKPAGAPTAHGTIWLYTRQPGDHYYVIQYPRKPALTAYLNKHLVNLADREARQTPSHFIKPDSRKPEYEQPLTFACPVTNTSSHYVMALHRHHHLTATPEAKDLLGKHTVTQAKERIALAQKLFDATANPPSQATETDIATAPAIQTPQSQPPRETPGQAMSRNPDITILTGQTPTTAQQATTLIIRAAKHQEFPDYLHTGRHGEGLYDLIMQEPGAAWIKASGNRPGYFRVPITFSTANLTKALWQHYGLMLERTCPTLGIPASQAIAERLRTLVGNHRLSREPDIQLRLPVPEGLSYLPYQRAGIGYAVKQGNALIADEPGLGKTIQAIGVSNALPSVKRILIIVPASLKINWQREFQKWDVKGLRVDRVSGGSPENWPEDTCDNPAQVVILNFDLVDQHYDRLMSRTGENRQPWDMMVIDEAHALKNSEAQRTQRILGSGTGKNRVPGIPAIRTLFLTGTPILNRPAELWTLAHALDPDFFRDKYQFERRYCAGKKTKYGWNARGASNLKELSREIRARFMVRRMKSQVLKDLPPKTRQLIELDHPAFARANGHFTKLEQASQTLRECFRRREQLDRQLSTTPGTDTVAIERYRQQVEQLAREAKVAFHQMSLVRKETALMKVPQVMDLVQTALANGKLILFCHHHEVAEAYKDALTQHFRKLAGKRGTPKTIAMVTGKTPNDKRQLEADRFQEDPDCHIFIGTIKAAGVGLTLTSASAVLCAELDWTPGIVSQAEDRAHRIGQLDHVLIYHAVVEGTLDALMVRRLIEKQAVIDSALDEADTPIETLAKPPVTEEDRLADWLIDMSAAADSEDGARDQMIDLSHHAQHQGATHGLTAR